jgi:hypothetical protein
MKINLSDTASESFILSKESSSKAFHFTSTEFHLYIIKASLVVESENSNWQQIIPKLALKLNVYYHITDPISIERAKELSFPIYLFIDPNHVQPVFELNKLVDKQIFGSDFDFEKIGYIDTKIELMELEKINELYYLQFEIKK